MVGKGAEDSYTVGYVRMYLNRFGKDGLEYLFCCHLRFKIEVGIAVGALKVYN